MNRPQLTSEEQEFYVNLYPCLVDRNWIYTGATAHELICWKFILGIIQYEEIKVLAWAEIVQYPGNPKLVARINEIKYLDNFWFKEIDIDLESSTATSDRVQQLCQQTAIDLLKENATEIRQARQQWLDEVARMKVEGDRA